uniref:Uncharacterized protein n=1 Tax=Kwoniella dejecticola CBS 10117 TaxID=1296121 RepID=A0A1A6A7E5_9TREE|nr:uncharacterized protein I303_03694 [Kwoniella dejecticola CBS 10117]OBR85979.1 hypothetical protein I303_03694 [Kwoniella dejecticola CBS 10117]
MQAMNRHGLRVLGVLAEAKQRSSGSDNSPIMSPVDEDDNTLISVVRGKDCARLVVPSEGKQALALSLAELIKIVEGDEPAGMQRGEERMPVHTLPPSTTLVYACHLILATASSRVFIRTSSPAPPNSKECYSPHSVLSIVDVFKCLVQIYM